MLGIDCPDWINAKVTVDAEASAKKRQHAIDVKDKREREASRAIILRLFPHIPANSLDTILDHGFEKGSRRVGRTTRLDETVKAKLAVNAHIRHSYTNYDSIYSAARVTIDGKSIKAYARAAVYEKVHMIADSWRTGYSNAWAADPGSIAQSSGPAPDTNVAESSSSPEVPATHPKAYAISEDIENAAKQILSTETRGCAKTSKSSTINSGRAHCPPRSNRSARQTAKGGIHRARKIQSTPSRKH